MFEKICIRQIGPDIQPIDFGFIVESALFYRHVDLAIGHGAFEYLLKTVGPENLLSLARDSRFSISIQEAYPATMSKPDQPHFFDFGNISIPAAWKLDTYLSNVIEKVVGRQGRARRLREQFLREISPLNLGTGVTIDLRSKIRSASFLNRSLRQLVRYVIPKFPHTDALVFEYSHHEKGFEIRCNEEIDEIAGHYGRITSTQEFSLAHLLSKLLDWHMDAHFSSTFEADLASYPFAAELLNDSLFATTGHEQIVQFKDIVLREARDIRTTVNSGCVSFTESMSILDKAEHFKEWISNINPNDGQSILSEYYASVTKETWIDKLPPRIARWALFTGLGVGIDMLGAGGAGTAAGIALSAGDAFLLDRILRGWKPSVFIEDDLKRFGQS